jgi:hypothetical protein
MRDESRSGDYTHDRSLITMSSEKDDPNSLDEGVMS